MADVQFVHYGAQKEGTFTPGEQADGSFIGVAATSRDSAHDCFERAGSGPLYRNNVTQLDRMLMANQKKAKALDGQKCYFRLVLPK